MRKPQEPHQVITFYSYKGGTGRTFALANIAWLLAAGGHRVCAVDWDLEGPGLHRYFRPFLNDPDLEVTEGLIDWLWEVSALQLVPHEPDSVRESSIVDYLVHIDGDFLKGGKLDLLPAGRQDVDYAKRINAFEWSNFYERLGGWTILDRARKVLKEAYDFVLIDSRTGVSDTSGICTIQFPDRLVACYTLNRQSIEGVSGVLASIQMQRRDRPLQIFPVEMRIEVSEKLKLDAARGVARPLFERFLSEDGGRSYWDDMEVLYWPYYAFEECLAVYADDRATQSNISMLATMQRMAGHVSGATDIGFPEIASARRREVMRKYAFGTNAMDADSVPVERPEIFDEIAIRYQVWQEDQLNSNLLQPSLLDRVAVAGSLPADLRNDEGFMRYLVKSRDRAELNKKFRQQLRLALAYVCLAGSAAALITIFLLKLSSSETIALFAGFGILVGGAGLLIQDWRSHQ
jgi:MinD-like ATPase involved in chromosome partitioning or flagellar assembly